jgi:predicted ATPase
MSEKMTEINSLPENYRRVIEAAERKYNVTIVPLENLVGGWSGAVVLLVSVSSNETNRVEHCILKLDGKGRNPKADEVTRHQMVLKKSGSEFAHRHIPELAFDRVEHDDAVAIFYRIAGQSLLAYLPLSRFRQQDQIKTLFTQTYSILLSEWNLQHTFEQALHPQAVLEKWLGFRLGAGRPIEEFLQLSCNISPEMTGFLVNGEVIPNPLAYARSSELWGMTRAVDIAIGIIHGDLNTNNILAKFAENERDLDGYYLIDFALYKEDMPLLYDQRYLEMSYLMRALSQASFSSLVDLLVLMAAFEIPDPQKVPIELSGVSTVISAARQAFAAWIGETHPSLQDDLWGQYWLAGVAAGLSYTHKAALPDEQRLAGLIFAAANLKRFMQSFNLAQPTEVALLFEATRSAAISSDQRNVRHALHNLPIQPTRFIGRSNQITALKTLLARDDVRLVTLMGPGGTGKTRLSLQVAEALLDQFRDGVTYIPLADDTTSDQFISRVAQQLHVRQGGRPLVESVKDFLMDQHTLLVLDNFEQLVSAAADVADLLAAAPKLKMMVTSRIALNLHGEHTYQVPPLNLPDIDSASSLEMLAENEAIHLFVERARAARLDFALTEDNATAVSEICRRLDGLPLALELAAARVKILPPQAILARLDNALKLLTGGARDLPSRHQTLRNTLVWSYDLLEHTEKILFARLSVFVGGFTLEAAEAVCNLDGQLDILEGLTSLVDNSLIRQLETSGDDARFDMLETVRAYALEQLEESGELENLQADHARYFGEIATKRVESEIYSEHALYWLDWLERELYNLRAMLNWCLTAPGGIALGVEVLYALTWFWYRRGYFIEGLTWAERFLAVPELQIPSSLRAIAQQNVGLLAVWKGEQDRGLAKLEESLEFLLMTEEARWIAPALISNAVAKINMGRDIDAQPLLEQARDLFSEIGENYFLVIALVHLGNVELGLGQPQKARSILGEALSIARPLNESWILSFVLNNLGEVARVEGQYDLARTYYEECEHLLRNTGDRGDMARFVHSLGYIAQHEGDYQRAEAQFRASLKLFRRLGNRRGIAESLAGLAGLKARQGYHSWGATLLGAAESLLQSTGGAWWPADRLEVEQNRAIIQLALSQDVFADAWETGEGMGIDVAVEFANHAP